MAFGLCGVVEARTFLYPSVATTVLEQVQDSDSTNGKCLTPRKIEILKHIAAGETNPQIATALGLSVKTVDWHRVNLMSKLDLHTVADLVRYALHTGIAE